MLQEPSSIYIPEYPRAVEYALQQEGILWFSSELKVFKDVHSILVDLTEAEKHGIITTLKLFTMYEMVIGDEYWTKLSTVIKKPACVSRMANMFSFVELNVHAPFYAEINEVLGLANEEFYTSYLTDPVLKTRMDMLEKYAETVGPEFLITLALTEGAVLYSSFAFIKHFQSNGKNKLVNICRGINMSSRDEALHSEASAWLFRTWLEENNQTVADYEETIKQLAEIVREHEYAIVDKIFERGAIEGITDVQLKHFVDSRINVVVRNLGLKNLYKVSYNPVADYFYDGMNNYQFNDFFAGQGREYKRDWEETAFEW